MIDIAISIILLGLGFLIGVSVCIPKLNDLKETINNDKWTIRYLVKRNIDLTFQGGKRWREH